MFTDWQDRNSVNGRLIHYTFVTNLHFHWYIVNVLLIVDHFIKVLRDKMSKSLF